MKNQYRKKFQLIILNKFILLLAEPRLVIFPACTINFACYRKHLTRFATPHTAHDTSKLTEYKRNTGRCTTQCSGKGVNG